MSEQPSKNSDLDVLKSYWELYGGRRALFSSSYFRFAWLFTFLIWPLWWSPNWWDLALSVLPNLLGFSLAGYAIFLAFGTEKFREFLSSSKIGGASAFLRITTTFMHFVLVQIVAVLAALFCKSAYLAKIPICDNMLVYLYAVQKIVWLCGTFLFVYSLTTALAALVGIFRLVRIADRFNFGNAAKRKQEESGNPVGTDPPTGTAGPP